MTEIRLYDTRARAKRVFTPLDRENVRMYVCGPTVYDRAHLGNARPVVVFDVLYRLLRHVYGAEHVTYVRNFTDVDDKIIARAEQTGRAIGDITRETTAWFLEDMGALGALEPDAMPRATEHIGAMVAMIEELIAAGHAYAAEGHVLFSVESYKAYGALSGRSVEDMIAGARIEVAPYKRNPMDFVLWKPSTPDQPGWDSPWGRGRPGWHIECSAMSYELFGPRFDIHGGGNDLMFPHHENEIAQSCCAHPAPEGEECFANYWLHNEMLQVEGKKMSKSLGNFFTVRDLLDDFRSEFAIDNIGPAIRLRFLQAHYRSPLDASKAHIESASAKIDGWMFLLEAYLDNPISSKERDEILRGSPVVAAVADDLNTPKAISLIDELMKVLKGVPSVKTDISGWADDQISAARHARVAIEFLGLDLTEMQNIRHVVWSEKLKLRTLAQDRGIIAKVEELIAKRTAARESKDFERADRIRDGLVRAGVEVSDGKNGVEWRLMGSFDPARLEALK